MKHSFNYADMCDSAWKTNCIANWNESRMSESSMNCKWLVMSWWERGKSIQMEAIEANPSKWCTIQLATRLQLIHAKKIWSADDALHISTGLKIAIAYRCGVTTSRLVSVSLCKSIIVHLVKNIEHFIINYYHCQSLNVVYVGWKWAVPAFSLF